MSVSDDIMKSYALVRDKATREGEGEPFELSVHVLTAAQWPTYPPVELRLPADVSESLSLLRVSALTPILLQMTASLERFRTFYTARNAGRRVAWAHSLGTLSIKATLPRAGEKELHVSLFQALVLLLFNDEERLSFGQIRERVGLEEKELRRTLQVSRPFDVDCCENARRYPFVSALTRCPDANSRWHAARSRRVSCARSRRAKTSTTATSSSSIRRSRTSAAASGSTRSRWPRRCVPAVRRDVFRAITDARCFRISSGGGADVDA